ncbi:hypothetical protein [Jannaschia ovalis]|uniref:Uncharacterized protein n=1 Tax=Jannaschia ovalis TaxID=3038773 RepID=A0ABY8LCE7_9RHOB|nr:hypothetical protein [Jannaschia sp. GRR-S6-38]WGH77863.1 hypothetical protein P8627_12575 [Jannaschia sp. GRR-S6-38]
MRQILLTRPSMPFLAACAREGPQVVTRTKLLVPPVPAESRRPVPRSELEAENMADIARILLALDASLDQAKGRIAATDCVLRTAEARAGQDVVLCEPVPG